ncbi:hypothetical protein OKA05_09000 [Luteolibacter arcticus]|uniref:UsfY protein n=1 Tax=Luteolibacter arcticus TaxID=1581411 RepID=A0ABT3GHN2_9BACT|nr:hypothetical protein [Luteolibacter arcticus]MCW1922689.1 hypothetical protein [Luteolibacter arcticus]
MKPNQARNDAEECRMMAGLLFAIAIVSLIAGGCVWYSLGPGLGLLACVTVAVVSVVGFFHETGQARRLDRIARQRLPLYFENHGHE